MDIEIRTITEQEIPAYGRSLERAFSEHWTEQDWKVEHNVFEAWWANSSSARLRSAMTIRRSATTEARTKEANAAPALNTCSVIIFANRES